MLGDLSQDLIGTDPKYPKVVNQGWLDVDKASYDNYPSDNNPVRVQPKLSEMWNHEAPTGPSIIPNATVQPLGVRTSEEADRDTRAEVAAVTREAKKAVMSGKKGHELSDHLKARFATKSLEAAADELKKVAEEVGLLGNVYVDASAFASYDEARQFMAQHKNRLARDLLFDVDKVDPALVTRLASEFRKNVVSSVNYEDAVLRRYRDHLVLAGHIPENFAVDSKEALKAAFLYEAPESEQKVEAKEDPRLDEAKVAEGVAQMESEKVAAEREAADAILWKRIRPIVSMIQEGLSIGKDASDLKEMVRSKFALDDIKDAADHISAALSEEGLSASNVDGLVESGKFSSLMGDELKKIGKQFPRKAEEFPTQERAERSVGVQGHFHALSGKGSHDNPFRTAAVEALKQGFSIEDIQSKLASKVSDQEASEIISAALSDFNALEAGRRANPMPKPKKMAVEGWAPKKTLPDESTITGQVKDVVGFFEGQSTDIEIDGPRKGSSVEIQHGSAGEGISEVLQ